MIYLLVFFTATFSTVAVNFCWCQSSSGIPEPAKHAHTQNQTHSIVSDTSLEHCQQLILAAEAYEANKDYQAAYDGYKAYIESCPFLSNSWTSFIDAGGANTKRSSNVHRSEEYRQWLKKVIYYNLDTVYYCADVGEILHTFGWFNDQRGRDLRGNLAVLYFLVKSNRCPNVTAYFDTAVIPATWTACHDRWMDSVSDPSTNLFDSTLPTLEDLDLGILRGPISGVVAFNNAIIGAVISNLRALENPFTSETTIAFDCREATGLKFEVYNILGKKVYDGGTHLYERGSNKLVVSGEGLASGILYARFSNPGGFVTTIKLRHQ